MPEIIVATEHDQVYQVWQHRSLKDISICHIDFHADIRGLLIDRPRQVAYVTSSRELRDVDAGNFMTHAIVNGTLTSMRWVHAPHGGRRYDPHSVFYESDLMAIGARLKHAVKGGVEIPFQFSEMSFENWDGVRPGEHLDIDWDGIAALEYPRSYVKQLIEDFLARDFATIPETTYLVFSPHYSHPDKALFEEFLERLAVKFSATITRLPEPAPQSQVNYHPIKKMTAQMATFTPALLKTAKRKIAQAIRNYETRNDLNTAIASRK